MKEKRAVLGAILDEELARGNQRDCNVRHQEKQGDALWMASLRDGYGENEKNKSPLSIKVCGSTSLSFHFVFSLKLPNFILQHFFVIKMYAREKNGDVEGVLSGLSVAQSCLVHTRASSHT